MNFKTFAKFLLLILIAWSLSPTLSFLFPYPSHTAVKEVLGEKLYDVVGRLVVELSRVTVWSVTLGVILKYFIPFMNFAVPAVERYSTTKLYRRFKAPLSDIGVIALIFIILTVTFSSFAPTIEKNVKRQEIREKLKSQTEASLDSLSEAHSRNFEFGKELIDKAVSSKIFMIDYTIWPHTKISADTEKKISVSTSYSIGELIRRYHSSSYWSSLKKKQSLLSWDSYLICAKKQIFLEKQIDEKKQVLAFLEGETENMILEYEINRQATEAVGELFSSFQSSLLVIIVGFGKYIIWAALFLFLVIHVSNKQKPSKLYLSIPDFYRQGRFGFGGSAHFAGMIAEWANRFSASTHSILLGRSLYNPFRNIGLSDDRHMITIAGSRAGKGVTSIIPNLLLWKGSALVIDPKGTNAAVTAKQRGRICGEQNVHLIDPFNVIKDGNQACFNILDQLDPKSPSIREQINVIAEALVVPDPNQKEKHWDDGARTILAGMIGHLITSDKYSKPDLTMLRELISAPQEEQDRLWVDMAVNSGAGRLPMDAANRVIRGLTTNEISSILSNADKHTEWLSSPAIKEVLSSSSFDLSKLKATSTTIYLIIPPEYLETHNRFLRLFVNLVINEMSRGGRSKVPVLLLMDEFLALGRMNVVEKAFGLMAGYNLILWPFIQDLGRLRDLYGKSVNAFIANSRAIQVFGVTDEETTDFVSKKLGEKSLRDGKIKSAGSKIVRLRTPTEVEQDIAANNDRQYILRAGKAPMVLEKIKYYESEPFKVLRRLKRAKGFKWLEKARLGFLSGKYEQDPDFN